MFKNNIPLILVSIILVVVLFFGKSEIKRYEQTISTKSKEISSLKLTIDEQSKIISNKKVNNNVKTITYINKDGSKKIEQIDLSVIEDNKSIDSSKKTVLDEVKEKSMDQVVKTKSETITNPKTIFIGLGTDNSLKPMIHLDVIRGSIGLGSYINKDFSRFGGYISIGF